MNEWEKWAEELKAKHQERAAKALGLLEAYTLRAKFIAHVEQPTWTEKETWDFALQIAQSMVAAEMER